MLIVGSMLSSNVAVISKSGFHIVSALLCLHGSGFALGYFITKRMGLPERICRTNSIEVGWRGKKVLREGFLSVGLIFYGLALLPLGRQQGIIFALLIDLGL